jgi:hypothetical protein
LILATASLSIFCWRRHWVSGLCLVCAAPLAIIFGVFPNPVDSPVGWAANVLKAAYYNHNLQQTYATLGKAASNCHLDRPISMDLGALRLDCFTTHLERLGYRPISAAKLGATGLVQPS